MSVLIKNGHIFTAVDNYVADILVDDGKIRTIGIDLAADAEKTIDATGKYVIPGGIDPHTHLDFPFGGTVSSDDFSTGTIAAAVGGTTSIVDFVVQQRGQALTEALEIWHQKAEGQAAIDYGFHMIVQDLPDHRLSEMDEMVRQGVTSFKMFMAYRGAVMVDDDTIFKAMVRASDNGALICLHAEHGHMIDVLVQQALAQGHTAPRFHASTRPPVTEAEATHRAIRMAEIAGAPVYFVHLSCTEALEQVQAARSRQNYVYAETCPHYLTLDNSMYDQDGFEGAKYVTHPAPAGQVAPGRALERAAPQRPSGSVHRPLRLPVQRPEDPGGQRLFQDSQRRTRNREPPEPTLYPRRGLRADGPEPAGGAVLDGSGQAVRPFPQKGHHRSGERRGHSRV